MRFRKYHGAGNDFVMIADREMRLGAHGTLPTDLVAALCDRHTGIGADGVIRVLSDPVAAAYMDYYNADGSAAGMCGNGIRCLVLHEQRAGALDGGEHEIATMSRNVTVRPAGRQRYTVDMGTPALRREEIPMTGKGSSVRIEIEHDGVRYTGSAVSMGNPHLVLFCDEIGRALDDDLVLRLGPQLEHHPDFPAATNVEFVIVENATTLRMRVWERGVGETMACGSGVCAVVVAAASLERTGPHARVFVPGGELEVEWQQPGGVWLTGPAEEVFSGEIDSAWLDARGLGHHASLVA